MFSTAPPPAPAGGPLHRRTFLAAAGAERPRGGRGRSGRPGRSRPVPGAGGHRGAERAGVHRERAGSARAQAVAVGTDGRILAVGSNADIRRRIGPRTDVIDAAGGTIMAGIHDGHMHPLGAALASLNPSLGNAEMTVPELRAAVQAMLDATKEREPDGWLKVTDWNPVGLRPAGTVADRSILDALSTSRPIALQGSDFHNMPRQQPRPRRGRHRQAPPPTLPAGRSSGTATATPPAC